MWLLPQKLLDQQNSHFTQEAADNCLHSGISRLCASEKGALGERSEPDVLEMERLDETPRKKDCAVVPSSPLPPVEAVPAREELGEL